MNPPAPRALALAAVLLALPPAAPARPDLAVSPAQRATAEAAAEAGVPLDALAPNAPDDHLVVPGDTLWGIASLFLRTPWRWPELWGLNLDMVRNPHRIYPGQRLVLERVDGRARLRLASPAAPDGPALPPLRLSPRVRDLGPAEAPVPPVPLAALRQFLRQTLSFEPGEPARAPRVVAGPEGRRLLGPGDLVHVHGDLAGRCGWQVFRAARPLHDPQDGRLLGHEARRVADADCPPSTGLAARGGDPDLATLRLVDALEEVHPQDRLAPAEPLALEALSPRPPAAAVEARVVAPAGEVLQAGPYQVVSVNRGQAQGLAPGQVLALWQAGATLLDRDDEGRPLRRRLPDERHGLLLLVRVHEHLAYGLVVEAGRPVMAGDRVTAP